MSKYKLPKKETPKSKRVVAKPAKLTPAKILHFGIVENHEFHKDDGSVVTKDAFRAYLGYLVKGQPQLVRTPLRAISTHEKSFMFELLSAANDGEFPYGEDLDKMIGKNIILTTASKPFTNKEGEQVEYTKITLISEMDDREGPSDADLEPLLSQIPSEENVFGKPDSDEDGVRA